MRTNFPDGKRLHAVLRQGDFAHAGRRSGYWSLGTTSEGSGRFSFAWTRLAAAAKTAPLQFDGMGGEFVRLLRTRHEYPIAASVIQMAAGGTAAGSRP